MEQEEAKKAALEFAGTAGPAFATLAVQLASPGGLSLVMVVMASLALRGLRRDSAERIDALDSKLNELQSLVSGLRVVANKYALEERDLNSPQVKRLLFLAETAGQRLREDEGEEVIERLMRFAPSMVEELDVLILERLCQQAITHDYLASVTFSPLLEELMSHGFTVDELEESVAVLADKYWISEIQWDPFKMGLPRTSRLTEYGFDNYLQAVYPLDSLLLQTAKFLASAESSATTLKHVCDHLALPEVVVLRVLSKLEDDGCVNVYRNFSGASIFVKPLIRRWIRNHPNN